MDPRQTSPAGQARERRRIVAGLLAALRERGPGAVGECDVIAAAATTPRAFHAHFADLDDCFDFACEAALDTLLTPMTASWSVPGPPPARLRAALAALLGSLAAQPRLAELCLRHSIVRQPDRRTYRRAVGTLAELLSDLRLGPRAGSPALAEEALARGVIGVIVARLADGADLEALLPQLLALLLPALGLDAARGLARSDRLDSA